LDFQAGKESIPEMKELQWDVILFIWIFNLIFFVLQEVGKLLVY